MSRHQARRGHPGRALLLVTSMVIAGRALPAQRPDTLARHDSAAVLAPIEVRGTIAPVARTEVVSGIPANISTITRADVVSRQPRLLADVLATQPGISIYDDLGSGSKLNVSARGFNTGPTVGLPPGITVFLDGVRQNEADAQEVNFDLLPLAQVKRIEVLRGNASLLGPNSLGGAINLVTESGGGAPSGELALSSGSWGGRGVEGSASGARGATSWHVGGEGERELGWREGTGSRRANLLLNLTHGNARRAVTVQGYAARARAETAGSLPESIFDVAPETNFTPGDYERVDVAQGSLSGYAVTGAGRLSATVYLRGSSADRLNVNQPPDSSVRGLTRNQASGMTLDWRAVSTVGSSALATRFGIDASASEARVRIFAEPPVGAAGSAAMTTHVRSPSGDLAAYAIGDWAISRLTFSAGGRWDRVHVPFRDVLAGSTTRSAYRHLSPRAGVDVEVSEGRSLYASFGRSFRAPAILELGCADAEATCPLPFALGDDPPLAPVVATTGEIGARWRLGPVHLDAAAYRSAVRDEIFFVASDQARLAGYFTNLPRTRREGVELAARGTAADARLDWYASATIARATFRTAATLFSIRSDSAYADSPLAGENAVRRGDQLPLVPRGDAKGGVTLRPRGWLDLGLDARWTGAQWLRGDEANETRPLPAFLLLDGRIAARRGGWELALAMANLLDSHHASFGTFNENRRTGALERFLTPVGARTLRLELRRALGTW